jgi:crotonobetainyl-CoA:carnitine CoA-transferase CaiB-like acyl-CoA transferase
MPKSAELPRPLEGVRVVDLTSIIFGPMATQLLADMGAEVIKVEAPGGDVVRHVEPMRSPGMGAVFLNSNRAKQSLVLDLKTEPGREALRRLVGTADVFVHSIRGQAAARLGIDYDTLKQIKSDLVYCFACGYDSRGPNADLPAYDDIIQAATGLASITTRADGAPQLVRTIIADKVGALYLSNAILGAIMTLKNIGAGQYVEVPMFECVTHFMMVEHMSAASFEPPMGPAGYRRVLAANRQTYRTKDSYIAMLPYTTPQWQRFLCLIGENDLAQTDWVIDPAKRSARIEELYGLIADITPERSTSEWVSELRRIDVPVTAVNTLNELFNDPQLQATDFFEEYDHPTEGRLRGTATPVQSSHAAPTKTPIAPHLGEQSHAILAELGYDNAEIDALIAAGAADATDTI